MFWKDLPLQPAKCHSQISCLRGQRRSTHALFSEYLLHAPAPAPSSPYKPPSKTCTKALHEDWPRPGPRPRDKSAPPCQHGSPPGRPWPFEGLRSMVRGGQPGPQESLRRGKRRPHLWPWSRRWWSGPGRPPPSAGCYIDLEEVAGRPVGVIQVLRLGDQPPGVRHGLRHFAAAAAAAAAPPRTPPPPQRSTDTCRRCCCPPRGHQARAQRSQGERARRAGVHPHARSSSPRPSGFRLPVPWRETADLSKLRARGPGRPSGSRGRGLAQAEKGNAVLELWRCEQVPAGLQSPQCTGRARPCRAEAELLRARFPCRDWFPCRPRPGAVERAPGEIFAALEDAGDKS